MRVVILPTGRTEWYGLPRALARLFPGHEFTPVPTRSEIDSNLEAFPAPGFTANRLTERQRSAPPEDVMALVERAAREAVGDRFSAAADLVLVLDDVEFANRENEAMVVAVARAAVLQHLSGLSDRVRGRTAAALRDRVSFHLARPMVEGWFFGDPGGLVRVGVEPRYVLQSDPECFTVDDSAYLAAEEAVCPSWIAAGRKRKSKPKWIDNENRHLHPKGYIQWLTHDASAKSCSRYSEKDHGAPALANLDWSAVLARPTAQFQYLRALVADVADALNQAPATGPISGIQAPLTSRFALPRDPVLRNL